ncbi:MAG: glycosyltransferase family 39 protein [bacterium]
MPSDRSPANDTRAVIALAAVAALLRFYGLGSESLWLDEGTTVWRIARGYGQLLFEWDDGTQGPLYYVALKIWCQIFGTTEFALRFPSAVLGVAAIPLVYRLARRYFDRATGLVAALLLTVNPFAIHYSQEARPYALFLLLGVASIGYLLRLLDRYDRGDAVAYVVASACAFYTHAFAPFLLMAHGAIVLIDRTRAGRERPALSLRRAAPIAAALALLCIPQAFAYAKELSDVTAGQSSANVIPEPTLQFLGKIFVNYFMSPWHAAAAFLVMTVGLVMAFGAGGRARVSALMLVAVGACCALLPWIVSKVFVPILTERYTIAAFAAAIILVAAGVARMGGALRAGALAALLIFAGADLAGYYTLVDKDPWRQTAEHLERESRAGDAIVVFPRWTYRPLDYHLDEPDGVRVVVPRETDDIGALAAGANRIFFVESYPGSASLRDAISAHLSAAYKEESASVINETLALNPHAYKLKPIRVTLYTRGD